MESTTLDDAVESLLAPSEETSEGSNFDEAVDAMIEPDDDQTEEVEVADEEQDDVEASSDEYDDVEIDDEDLVEAQAEDTNLIPVKVDGKEEMWTLDQLKQSAAGQAAINKRFQEAAEARKQIEQRAAALQQQQQQLLQLHQQAQNGGLQAPTPPTRELFESDPIGYMEEKLKYDEAKAQYDQNMFQLQNVQRQRMQAQEQAHQAYLQEQAQVLTQYIPEIADPEKGEAIKNALVDTGVSYGFTAEEMQGVTDARYVRALNDARKYRELVAKRKSAQSKGEKARPMVKSGAKKRQDSNVATRKKAQTRLQKTGSIDDALSLILNQ
ncbi:MAG: hypothetical protein GWP50_12000 [Proteobacteria bacterium]|nr:hypothetical protein [Pseudomonadota bacterium]